MPFLVALCLFAAITSWPWNIVAATVSIAIAISVFYDRYKRWKRSRLLRKPFEIHFLIPKATEYRVDYYPQDDDEHHPDSLTLPSNLEEDVMVWMKPRLDVVLSELQFGCIGEPDSKPEPLYYFLPWVKEGVRKEKHPEVDENHYKDYTNIYHVVCHGRAWPKDEVMLSGLKMRTKKKGRYAFWVGFIMPEGRAEETRLTINVE